MVIAKSKIEGGLPKYTDSLCPECKKIIKAKNPRTRYLVGNLAKPVVKFRHFFGDRAMDWLIKVTLK